MPVKTALHTVFVHHVHQLTAYNTAKRRRIMQKYDCFRSESRFAELFCRLKRHTEPPRLTVHNLQVLFGIVRLQRPPPRPRNDEILAKIRIVEQKVDGIRAKLLLEAVELRHSLPPVIVISFADDFSARQIVNECKILRSGIEPHSP